MSKTKEIQQQLLKAEQDACSVFSSFNISVAHAIYVVSTLFEVSKLQQELIKELESELETEYPDW